MVQGFGMASETADAMAGGFEKGQKATTDVTGGAGEQNQSVVIAIWHGSNL
jgi:hypothetical protein